MIGKYDLTDIVFAANDCTPRDRCFIASLVLACTSDDDPVPPDHRRGLVHFLLRRDPHDPKTQEIQ